MTNNRRVAAITIAAALVATALAGCTSSGSSGSLPGVSHADASRVRFYSSLQDLSSDSAAVVAGTVTAQRAAKDIDQVTVFTISTVTVQRALKGSGIAAGSTVEVRQIGDSTQATLAPLLSKGSSYLLYLTLSGLSGNLASQYYVTGGDAGIYQASSAAQSRSVSPSTFSRAIADDGDKLPATVDLSHATG